MRTLLGLTLCLVLAGSAQAATPDSSPLGRPVDDFSLRDFRGREWSLGELQDKPILVVAFLGTECPLVKLYAARLAKLASDYAPRGVAVLGINSNQQDSITEIAHFARVHNIEFPLLKDPGNVVADQFAAQRTPEVFVLDADRRVRYHGRIDDQYNYGLQRPQVTRRYLVEALEDLLAGRPVGTAETETVGCHIGRILEASEDSGVTYSKQISRIFQARCVECHRDGEIAPFSLTSYDEVVGWAEMIAEVVREQRMPPWHADPQHGTFINDARLSDGEKQLIYDWVRAGAPEGDSAQLPPPREFVEGWRIGEPDLVIYMADEPFQVPAEGEVKYQYFSVDPGFTEDTWVQAAECRPGNRAVVHHIIVASASRETVAARAHGELASDWLAATAPGARPLILDEGRAKLIPAGARLVFQMHYTPNGTPQQDRSCVGLILADPEKVKQQVVTQKAANSRFRIPPGAANHRVESTHRFAQDSLMLAMFPHMHLRGKSFRYTALYPDGNQEVLLDVPRYDFNWQNSYEFAEPKLMPAGTQLKCVAHFDNSQDNLANPDPTAEVRWGDQTWEEMMIGYFDMVLADQDLTTQAPPQRRTDQFLALVRQSKPQLDRQLIEQAAASLSTDAALERFSAGLRRLVPQLDRVDWMTVDGGQLHVKRVAQDTRFGQHGGSGISVPAASMQLARYAEGKEVVVHRDTTRVTTPDFRLLSRLYASSLHVPVEIDATTGLISFWSREADAFPPEAVQLLQDVVRALGNQSE